MRRKATFNKFALQRLRILRIQRVIEIRQQSSKCQSHQTDPFNIENLNPDCGESAFMGLVTLGHFCRT